MIGLPRGSSAGIPNERARTRATTVFPRRRPRHPAHFPELSDVSHTNDSCIRACTLPRSRSSQRAYACARRTLCGTGAVRTGLWEQGQVDLDYAGLLATAPSTTGIHPSCRVDRGPGPLQTRGDRAPCTVGQLALRCAAATYGNIRLTSRCGRIQCQRLELERSREDLRLVE